jgi:glyoxylase-like metal-dependent hydrolase (beta-lactamase superfamily II)
MEQFVKEIDGIYRLRVPFETVYTSVFLIETDGGAVLVDCATTPYDVDNYILPALKERKHELSDLLGAVITHRHGDHAGGIGRILEHAPDIRVITEVGAITEDISVYPMAGHTEDMVGVLDKRTRTLISGDGLQGAGVDKYRCYVKSRDAYLETIERIRNDKRIENILFSHAYEPWYKDGAFGRETVEACLSDCLKYV